ncbi:MAG: DUF992 domain-containing protein [Alphaproteobacteria bacterium]|nr:DUF992 domain-containing protein [Alphaproteobacteria bacterium]MBV9862762.1 DUF992 domain-containing protein [Alphaproteobacteria bacterium]
MLKKFTGLLTIGAALLGLTSGPAAAQGFGLQIGWLTCNVAGGPGYVLGSSRPINCMFWRGDGPPEHYVGQVTKLGIDIGYTQMATLYWAVFAPGFGAGPGWLNGAYIGGGAGATVGFGVGANVLVGGYQGTINLQPVSVQTSLGLDVTAGVGGLTLQYQP